MGVYARGDDCDRIVDRTAMNRRHALGLNTDGMCNRRLWDEDSVGMWVAAGR